ncbi:Chemotaxis protein CheW [Novipirellula galeiformis]|uniref:Chemotaxis protein CheW n=1 Tax=Novipirellula galeiformis TaxID=2528004 RepID=A0A5C6C8M6_9BACT|nr:chemotaxis protein CheW [Novipirellula galeiformis]TWU20528.1 Chemotaxis protein CheW [Novipirellula galeiformis]
MEIEILVFECGGRHFGVDAQCVRGVLRAVALAPVPQAPDVVMGLVNLRGRILTVLDTQQLLGLGASSLRHSDHLIVVDAGACEMALHVDQAIDLLSIEQDNASEYGHQGGEHLAGSAPLTTPPPLTKPPHSEAPPQLTDTAPRLVRTVAKTHLGVVQVLAPSQWFRGDAMKEILAIATSTTATQLTPALNL